MVGETVVDRLVTEAKKHMQAYKDGLPKHGKGIFFVFIVISLSVLLTVLSLCSGARKPECYCRLTGILPIKCLNPRLTHHVIWCRHCIEIEFKTEFYNHTWIFDRRQERHASDMLTMNGRAWRNLLVIYSAANG